MAYGDYNGCVHHPWGWWRVSLLFQHNVFGTANHPAFLAGKVGLRIRSDHWFCWEAVPILGSALVWPSSPLLVEDYNRGLIGGTSAACASDGNDRFALAFAANDPQNNFHLLAMSIGPPAQTWDYVTGNIWALGGSPFENVPIIGGTIVWPGGRGNAPYIYTQSQIISNSLIGDPCAGPDH